MYCDACSRPSYSTRTTRRITKSGIEILIQHCGHCKARVETEFIKIKTTRITVRGKK